MEKTLFTAASTHVCGSCEEFRFIGPVIDAPRVTPPRRRRGAGCAGLDGSSKHKLELGGFTVYDAGFPRYAEFIGKFGGGVVVRESVYGKFAPADLTAQMKDFFEKLKPQIEQAVKAKARLAIENHGDALLNTPDSLKAFVDLNPAPDDVGIALAPYHLQGIKASVEDAIATCGAQLAFFYAWQNAPRFKLQEGDGLPEAGRRRDLHLVTNNPTWAFPQPEPNPYRTEWEDLFEAILKDKPYNEVKRGVEASLVTSMGRMAAHTGQEVTYEQMLKCVHEFAPGLDQLKDDSPAPLQAGPDGKYPVPQPGRNKEREY